MKEQIIHHPEVVNVNIDLMYRLCKGIKTVPLDPSTRETIHFLLEKIGGE
jgi:hypothetical protein